MNGLLQWVKTEAVRDIVRNFYEYYGLAKVLPARGGIMLNSFPVTENMVGSTCLMSGSESKKDNDTAAVSFSLHGFSFHGFSFHGFSLHGFFFHDFSFHGLF